MNISPEISIGQSRMKFQEDNTGLVEIQAALDEIEKLKTNLKKKKRIELLK